MVYRKIGEVTDFLTKAASQVIWTFFITINLITLFRLMLLENFQNYDVDKIFMLSLLNYGLSQGLSHLINIKREKHPKIIYIIPIFTFVVSLFTATYIMGDSPTHIKVMLFFYYLILWKKGVDFSVDEYDIDTYREGFWVSFVFIFSLLIFLFLLMGVRQNYFYKDVFMRYVPIYLIISIVTLFRITFIDAYDNRFKNAVNSERNILKVNIFSAIIVSASLLVILTNYMGRGINGVSFIYTVVKKLSDYIILGLAYVVVGIDKILNATVGAGLMKIFMVILGYIIKFINFVTRFGEESNPDKVKITDSMVETIANIGKYAGYIAILTIIIIAIIVRLRNKVKLKKRKIIVDGEEKDFIFQGKGKGTGAISHSIKGLKNSILKKYIRQKRFKQLHIIRQLYIKAIKKSHNAGNRFERYYTPNEYLESEVEKSYLECGFDKLTKCYNKVRYGKKELMDKEIESAKIIGKKINSIK